MELGENAEVEEVGEVEVEEEEVGEVKVEGVEVKQFCVVVEDTSYEIL